MIINILNGIEGSKQATGLTVIIDVFRAFSLEAYIMNKEPLVLRPVSDKEIPLIKKKENNEIVIIGERHAIKLDGYDYGNSPTELNDINLKDKIIYHTTSAGTQGIANATNADEIITGSLVNAKAIAEYIRRINPSKVSLVAMGREGGIPSEEDTLCANYIKSLLDGNDIDLTNDIEHLKNNGGKAFFEDEYKDFLPRDDFYYCTDINKFNFVLKVERDNEGLYIKRIDI